MASKQKPAAPAKAPATVPAKREAGVLARHAEVIYPESGGGQSNADVPLPAFLEGKKMKVLPSGLTPVLLFAERGDYAIGAVVNTREDVGPNGSTMYDFRLPTGQIVSHWGSTIFDTVWANENPPKGAIVFIQYMGTKPTKVQGRNPAKDWLVGVLPGPLEQYTQ